jgi:type II secretory pathway pseudopilin PulG
MSACSRPKGRTLLEVLVAGAIFAVISMVMVLSMRSSRSGEQKVDAHSEAQSACLAALHHLRTEMRGVRVLLPVPDGTGTVLSYQRPELAPDGNVVISATGDPVFLATPVNLAVGPGGLWVTDEAEPRVIGRLLDQGQVSFTRIGGQILQVEITARHGNDTPIDRRSSSQVVARLAIRNS